MTLRTEEQDKLYRAFQAEGGLAAGCALCNKDSIKDFSLWRIIPNSFPYDKIANEHHMIIPRRHAAESDLTIEETAELSEIKEKYLHSAYDYFIEATHKLKSIPEHFHLHLIVAKS